MYAIPADLTKRIAPQTLAELTDDNNDGLADTEILEAVLADASAEIDLFLAARYATPVESPPDVLRRYAADIAIYALFTRKRSAIAAEYGARYASAIRSLSSIAAGRLHVPGAIAWVSAACTHTVEDKHFTPKKMANF